MTTEPTQMYIEYEDFSEVPSVYSTTLAGVTIFTHPEDHRLLGITFPPNNPYRGELK